jgi:hypothetical protein
MEGVRVARTTTGRADCVVLRRSSRFHRRYRCVAGVIELDRVGTDGVGVDVVSERTTRCSSI